MLEVFILFYNLNSTCVKGVLHFFSNQQWFCFTYHNIMVISVVVHFHVVVELATVIYSVITVIM